VGEVGVDVGEQVAHHRRHAGTHVFGGQTGEVPRGGGDDSYYDTSVATFGQCGIISPPEIGKECDDGNGDGDRYHIMKWRHYPQNISNDWLFTL